MREAIPESVRKAKYKETIECHYCGIKTKKYQRHLDHIVPVQKGGTNDPANLVVSCKTCNTKKSILPYEVFIDKEIARVELQLLTLKKRKEQNV